MTTANKTPVLERAKELAASRKLQNPYRQHQINEIVAEVARRQAEALRIFEPLPHVEPFHQCTAPERILRGSNRSGKAQPIDEPVLTPDGWREIGKLSVGDVVIGGDGKPCTVTGVYPQGVKPVFRITFGGGAWTRCCEEHLWKVQAPQDRLRGGSQAWQVWSLAEIRRFGGDEPPAHRRVAIPTISASTRELRKIEADGEEECVCIAVSSEDQTYVTRNCIVTHNTLHAAVEFARAVTGQDPYNKYPKTDGRAFVVGATGQHISEVLYRKVFRAGAFKMIKDGNLWRTFRPWDPEDAKREHEAKLAPPLIPPRMIKTISWENKKEQIPNVVRMKNGWEIRFFSSQGIPPQGSDVSLVWFDEEVVHNLWYSEVAARGTVDRNGKFFWSATAQKGGPQLYEMCERAEEIKNDPNPRIVEFFAHINDNKHFTDEQREQFFFKLSEEERAIRIEGEFAFTSFKVYPEFDRRTHAIEWFHIPETWTRFLVVDPGRQVAAALFAAVPPPDYSDPDLVVLYDEIYLRQSTAKAFGEEVRHKTQGQVFEAFIIDHQGGRVRDPGRGLTIEEQYAEEFKRHGVKSRTTGHAFKWGSTDVRAGIERVRSWLLIRDVGRPKLMYFRDKCPNFEHEMTRYHWKRKAGVMSELTEEPEKRNDHQCDNIRYLSMYGPKYVKPTIIKRVAQGAYKRLQEKRKRQQKMSGQEGISLGGVAEV